MMSAKNGSVVLSDQLTEHSTIVTEVNTSKRCFIGDISRWTDGEEGWKGDEISASSHNGKVKVCYVDEVPVKGKGGVWNRVFGL